MDEARNLILPIFRENCVDWLNVDTYDLRVFAGSCNSNETNLSGHRLTDLRMRRPYGVAHDNVSTLYISLHTAAFTIISIENDTVKDVIPTPFWISRVYFDAPTNSLYLTVHHGLATIQLDSKKVTLLAGSEVAGGENSTAMVQALSEVSFKKPVGVVKLGVQRWLVADVQNDRSVRDHQL